MDDIDIQMPQPWDEDTPNGHSCPLCEYADDAGTAMGYLKKMDTALGGRTSDDQLSQMMEESYNIFFYKPMCDRNIDVPKITAEQMLTHFSVHDINPLRILKKDINRLEQLQDSLCPRTKTATGTMAYNDDDAKQWMLTQRLKMDLIQQFERTNARTPRDLPEVPTI